VTGKGIRNMNGRRGATPLPDMKMYRILLAAVVATSLVTNFARAFSITSVTFSPGDVVPPGTAVEMTVNIVTPSQSEWLYAPTQVSSNANSIRVDVFPTSGMLTAIGFLQETIALGPLAPGRYEYEVVIHPNFEVHWGTRTNRGVFIVQREVLPGQLALVEPADGRQFLAGETIPLLATTTNEAGPWYVEFFSGDQRIATSTPNQPVWWSEAWGGQHVISARATNPQGTTLTSDPVTIQVGPGAAVPVVSIGATPATTGEPCPTCLVAPSTIVIRRTDPTNTALTVSLAIGGTATPGDDYPALPSTITIPAGQRSVQRLILPNDDALVEGPEVVRVQVRPSPNYLVHYSADEALVVIRDNESNAPTARLDIIAPTNGARLFFTRPIELAALAVNLSNEVYGPVEFYAGDALIARSQITASTRPPIPGLPSIHTAYWTNPPLGEHILTARTRLSFSQSITSAPVSITVDSAGWPVVRLETWPATNAWAPEFCPPNVDCAYPSFIARRIGPTDTDLRVFLSYFGTATPDVDYPRLPSTVIIPAGREAAYITVVPTDDTLVEGAETIVARFTLVPGAEYIPDPAFSSATITIVDNEARSPVISIIQPTNGTEFPPNTDIQIVVAALDEDGYVRTVEFFADGRKIGERHLFIEPPPPGETQRFDLTWGGATPGPHVLTARAIDNDNNSSFSAPVEIRVGADTPPVVNVATTDCFAVEPSSTNTANPAAFLLLRSGPTNSSLTVRYSLSGVAQNGVDYERLNGSAVIAAGRSSVVVSVVPLADSIREGMETVVLQIDAQADYVIGRQGRAVAVIADTLEPIPLGGIRWTRLPDRGLHLCFIAQSGREFRVEASNDLRDWDTVSTTTAIDGALHFIEGDTTRSARRFYRIAPEP
jgi:hypothetical protein